jgi:quercetin dioxygenase-like cupin family protein
MKFVWLAAGFFALFISQLQAQERKDVTVTQLLSTTVTSSGQPIVLPQKDAQIVVSTYDVVPGATLPVHKHPYPRYAYVLSGHLRVTNSDTGRSNTYKTGDFILESVGQWHTGANIGDEPVKLLVIDMVERGQTNTLPHEWSARCDGHADRPRTLCLRVSSTARGGGFEFGKDNSNPFSGHHHGSCVQ